MRLVFLSCCFLIFNMGAQAQTKVPHNAVYTAIRIHEIVDSLKWVQPLSGKQDSLRQEMLVLLWRYAKDGKYIDLSRLSKYQNLDKFVGTYLDSLQLDEISKLVKDHENEVTKKVRNLIGSVQQIDSIVKTLDTAISYWEGKLSFLDRILKSDMPSLDQIQNLGYFQLEGILSRDSNKTDSVTLAAIEKLINEDSLSVEDHSHIEGWMEAGKDSLVSLKGKTEDSIIKARERRDSLTDRKNRQHLEIRKELRSLKGFLEGKDQSHFLHGFHTEIGWQESSLSIKMEFPVHYPVPYHGQSMAVPSQTQMIDAMAIFLANRVKEEAVIWFFEQLKRNAILYDDLKIIFPRCMELLASNEIFETPDLGRSWRFAIAEDFVHLPEQMLQTSFAVSFSKIQLKREVISNHSWKRG